MYQLIGLTSPAHLVVHVGQVFLQVGFHLHQLLNLGLGLGQGATHRHELFCCHWPFTLLRCHALGRWEQDGDRVMMLNNSMYNKGGGGGIFFFKDMRSLVISLST